MFSFEMSVVATLKPSEAMSQTKVSFRSAKGLG